MSFGFQFGRLTFAPGTFVLILWSVAIAGVAYFAILPSHTAPFRQVGARQTHRGIADGTRLFLQAAAFVIASGVTGTTFSYLSASLGMPLRDAELAAIDKAIGFDWQAFLAFTNQHQILSWVLKAAYHAAGATALLYCFILELHKDGDRLADFLAVLALSNLMTAIVVTLVPAEGAYAYYQPAGELFTQYSPTRASGIGRSLQSLRNDTDPILDFARVQGWSPSHHFTQRSPYNNLGGARCSLHLSSRSVLNAAVIYRLFRRADTI